MSGEASEAVARRARAPPDSLGGHVDPWGPYAPRGGGGAMVAHFHHCVGERRAHDHSITWCARSSIDGGMVRPSVRAVLRLITSSYFVGCSTGRSLGLAPLRILST